MNRCEVQKNIDYLRSFAHELVKKCVRYADDGTKLFEPDGVSSYHALWLRDFSYMAENLPEAFSAVEIMDCVDYAFRARRADGWLPDRTYGDGTGIYTAGAPGAPIGLANLDNPIFFITDICLAKEAAFREGAQSIAEFERRFAIWKDGMLKGLDLLPVDEDGLIFNDPDRPHSPYGFTDTVAKTGKLFMESVLYWRALKEVKQLCADESAEFLESLDCRMAQIEQNIQALYDEKSGMFYAAGIDCRQVDIWGNAYALYIGFPFAEEVKAGILKFLKKYYYEYVYCGQVRHLLNGEYWERLLIDVERGTYQNGAFWGTASGWVMWCIAQEDETLAQEMLADLVEYFQKVGSYECVNVTYKKLDTFVASATAAYGGAVRAFLTERNG